MVHSWIFITLICETLNIKGKIYPFVSRRLWIKMLLVVISEKQEHGGECISFSTLYISVEFLISTYCSKNH